MGRAAVSATCAPELQTHRVALLFSTPRFDLDYNSGIFWGMLGKLHPYLAWATATAPGGVCCKRAAGRRCTSI